MNIAVEKLASWELQLDDRGFSTTSKSKTSRLFDYASLAGQLPKLEYLETRLIFVLILYTLDEAA